MTIMTKTIFITKMTLTTIKYDLKNTDDLNDQDNLNDQDAHVGYNQEQQSTLKMISLTPELYVLWS